MKESSKVRIFVATHKPGKVRHDEVYTPIHVGRAISKYKEEMAEMLGDDTGDNISEKNPFYSEMTAHYWIWKNVKDVEYVGLCHYRRLFGVEITEKNIDRLMKGYDVMMVTPDYKLDSVYSCFARFVSGEDLTILSQVVRKLYPQYYPTLVRLCDGVKFYPFNMFICKKELYDKYAEWMFSILFECEKYIRTSPYSNAKRTIGYLAEMITQVFFIHSKLEIKTVPYCKVEDERTIIVKPTFLGLLRMRTHEFLLGTLFANKLARDSKAKFENLAILNGLKNDGIVIV